MMSAVTLTLAAAVLAALAVAMAWILGWANRAFHVEVDPKVAALDAALPGANCGGCGYVGCSEYAEAVAAGEAEPTLCAPGGSACAEALGAIMGVQVGESLPYRPVVHCAAHLDDRLLRVDYEGEVTCAGANLVGGVQGCAFGCLGLGDCVAVCKYDAIHVVDGLATVDYERCIGCKACARACPRNLITMVPFKRDRMLVVACSNQDFGPDVKDVCQVGCIGCKGCTRTAEMIEMDGNKAVVDYDRYDPDADLATVVAKCPRDLMLFVGRPTPEQAAAVAHEEIPDHITAEFKTTVDDTEWRG